MINLNAKQIPDLQISRLDNATLLSAVDLVSQHVQHSAVAVLTTTRAAAPEEAARWRKADFQLTINN